LRCRFSAISRSSRSISSPGTTTEMQNAARAEYDRSGGVAYYAPGPQIPSMVWSAQTAPRFKGRGKGEATCPTFSYAPAQARPRHRRALGAPAKARFITASIPTAPAAKGAVARHGAAQNIMPKIWIKSFWLSPTPIS
jgi:hypothetical protein